MANSQDKFEVVVAGGGMVGLTLGLALAQAGIETAVVDGLDPAVHEQPGAEDGEAAQAAHEDQARSLEAAPKKLLVVTVTTGFRHSVIPLSENVLTQLAAQSGGAFTVEFVRQPAGEPKSPPKPRAGKDGDKTPEFLAAMAKWQEADKAYQVARAAWMPAVAEALRPLAPANLKHYDGVVFASTTGDLPLPDKQGFLDWIAAGHAFVGIHAATDTFHGFPAFIAMIGGEPRPKITRNSGRIAMRGIG
jgi:hypothetical protein